MEEKIKDTKKYLDSRCTAILDQETGRRCRAPAVNGTLFCHAHGTNAMAWRRKGWEKSGRALKKLWDERKRKAAILQHARNWEGFQTLVLAQIADEYIEDLPDKRFLAYLMQRLENGIREHLRAKYGEPIQVLLETPGELRVRLERSHSQESEDLLHNGEEDDDGKPMGR